MNIPDKEEHALRAYAEILEGRFGPQLLEVLFFGSKARDEARPEKMVTARRWLLYIDHALGIPFHLAVYFQTPHGSLLRLTARSPRFYA